MRRDVQFVNRVSWMGLMGLLVCFALMQIDSHAGPGGSVSVDVNLFASAVISENVSIMVGDRGRIFLSEDRAKTWRLIDSGTKRALVAVCFPDDRYGWAVGQGGEILQSTDGGRTWEAQVSGVDTYLMDLDFIDSRHGFAVGADSTVVVTADGGTTWKRSSLERSLDLAEEINLYGVVVMDTLKACIVGDRGRVFTTQDRGQSWVESKSPLYDEQIMEGRVLYSLTYDSDTLYAVGIDGAFVYSNDQGRTWTEAETGFPGPELYCIDVVGGVGLAAGSGGHIIQTSDGGSTWRVIETPERVTRSWLSGIDLRKTDSGSILGLIVGENGVFGLFEDGTLSW